MCIVIQWLFTQSKSQVKSSLLLARHTHFKTKIGVPPFPCTVGMKSVTRWRTEPCGVRSLDVKSTEVNTKKVLKTRHFRELGVRFSSTLLNDKRTLLCYENKG